MLTESCAMFFSPSRAVLSAILRDKYLTSAVSNKEGDKAGSNQPPKKDHVTPICTKFSLHQVAPKWTTSHQFAPSCTKLHHVAPKCTMFHQSAPSCTKRHHVAPIWIKLHHLAPSCTNLHQVEPTCTKLH